VPSWASLYTHGKPRRGVTALTKAPLVSN